VYSAIAPSIKGDLQVFLAFEGSEIREISVIDEDDSPVIKDVAIASMTQRIVEQQNIEVDTVSGATMTSMAILAGVEDCLRQAGANVEAFRKGSDQPASKEAAADEDCDLLIIGSGMAGLSSALYALRQREDLKVIVVEKQAYPGGSSRVCGGGVFAFSAPQNTTVGQVCSEEDYLSFMQGRAGSDPLNAELMGNIYALNADVFSHLMNWGLPLGIATWYLGNPQSQIPCFNSTESQRQEWETGESGIVDFMATLARNQGVDIRLNSKVTELVVEGNAVTGVLIEDLASTCTIKAKKVVIASGGFSRNPALVEKYAPDLASGFAFTGSGSTGDAIAFTEKLGTSIVGTGMMGLFGMNPNLGYYGPLGNTVYAYQASVNAEGKDLDLKSLFYADRLRLLCQQTNNCGYGICDSTNPALDRLEAAAQKGLAGRYQSLDELAEDQGIEAEGLKAVCEGADITQAPFYCVVQRPLFIGSIPGLKVGAHCEVLGAGDLPVENLYAAGEVMFGNVFSGAYPCSGAGMGTSCYTGALAAQAALAAL
jgi:fumarate reductase flavoprotein subunit